MSAVAGQAAYRLVVTHGSGDGWYNPKDNINISADPPPAGKVFYRWDGTRTKRLADRYSPNTVYRMPHKDATLTAVYTDAPGHKLSVINGSGSGTYAENISVSISANAPPAGKMFKQWTGSSVSRVTDPYSRSTTFSMPGSDTSLTATYINIPQYNLTVNNGSGSGSYHETESVTITADQAPAGKGFKEWTGSFTSRLGNKNAATTTFLMPDQDASLTATYENLPVLTINRGAGDGAFPENTSVIIVADTPPEGKKFKIWTGSQVSRIDDPLSSSTSFMMPGFNTSLTATYEDDNPNTPKGMQNEFSIVSVGTFDGETHIIVIENIRNRTWAQYALWSNNNRGIYFIGGEKFHGAVHANTKLYFYNDPEFFDKVTSASATYGGSTNAVTFHKGFDFPVAPESLASVDFDKLKSKASVIFEGQTTIKLQGTNMVVSNTRAGLNNTVTNIPHNSLIYIKTSNSGSSSTRPGDVYIEGNLHERLTVVSDRDISITSHITYDDSPITNAASLDALGLISKRDVIVKPSCPDNVKICAHILATGALTSSSTDGSFGVENYNSGNYRGEIHLLGGIAQDYRGAVGTFSKNSNSRTGYSKRYNFDERFSVNPPPEYPPLSNRLIQGLWRDR
jgi:hypothetical protein